MLSLSRCCSIGLWLAIEAWSEAPARLAAASETADRAAGTEIDAQHCLKMLSSQGILG